MSSRCWPRPGTRSCRSWPTTPTRRRASTTGPSWRRPRPSCAAAPTRGGCERASPWSTPPPPTSTPPSMLAPDVTLFPGTVLQGATVVGAGTEIGPDTRLVDTRVGARAKVNETVATLAEIGDDAVVGPVRRARAGRPHRCGRADRAVLHWRHRVVDRHTVGKRVGWSSSPRRSCTWSPGGPTSRWPRRSPAHLDVAARRAQPQRVRQRRDPLPLRRVGPGHRRLHHPEPRRQRRRCRSTTPSWSS